MNAQGQWGTPFDHQHSGPEVHPSSHSITNPTNWITADISPTHQGPDVGMNVVHASVIPSGPHRGEVLVWDGNLGNVGVRASQPWAIVNPYWPAANPFVPPGPPPYRFHNALETCPTSPPPQNARLGDFFCAGQCWLANGRLFVAGGTRQYPLQTGLADVYEGSQLVYQWDPNPTPGSPFGTWWRMTDLAAERWYPSVTADGTAANRVLILGGTDWSGSPPNQMFPVNSYESYLPSFPTVTFPTATFEQKLAGSNPRLYAGPMVPLVAPFVGSVPGFDNYPRMHALGVLDPLPSGGFGPRLFVSGYWSMGFHWAHDPNVDPPYPAATAFAVGMANQTVFNDDGASILYPAAVGAIPSLVVRIGGGWRTAFPGPFVASNVVESVEASVSATTGSTWSTGLSDDIPDMLIERWRANIVILPDRTVFAVGGTNAAGANNLVPEMFEVGRGWGLQAAHASPRDYHSTAVLLPDGRVFVAGGEASTSDYQIYTPQYLLVAPNRRPQGVSLVDEHTLAPISQTQTQGVLYGQSCLATLSAKLPAGLTIQEAVLMAPAALTHHDDGGQRCIPLLVAADPGSVVPDAVRITMPASQQHAPPGWYMLFLLTNGGVPSNAYWVNLG